jgi:LemA protein
MSGSLLLWTVLAVLLFWGVGLYNRLMRMRARGFSAFGSVEKHLREHSDLAQGQLQRFKSGPDGLPFEVPGEVPPEWGAVQRALEALDDALKAARATPLAIEPLAGLTQAMAAVRQVWHSLQAVPADLAGPVLPHDVQTQWDAIAHRVETSRNGYNQIVVKYNEALAQFPARLVIGLMGFKPGGIL